MDGLTGLAPGWAALITGVLLAAVAAIAKAWPRARDFVLFLTDLMGSPERPGKPRSPGLMERMATVEDLVRATAEAAGAAQTQAQDALDQLRPNGGGSLWDKVNTLGEKVDGIGQSLEQHVVDSARAPRRGDDPPEADFTQVTH
jgi:hypothetical protein